MRKWLAGIVAGLLLGTALSVEAQGPFTAQIQRALASFRAGAAATTFLQAGIGSTSTTGATLRNTTLATAGATVQMSPALQWHGSAWDTGTVSSKTADWVAEVLTASANPASSVWQLANSINGAGYLNELVVSDQGVVTSTSSLVSGSNVQAATGSYFVHNGRSAIGATANKLVQVLDSLAGTGLELDAGTPTLGTCTGGTLVSGSHNSAGEVTGTTGGSCIINFGVPNFTNIPFCTVSDETAAGVVDVTAHSAASITVSVTSPQNFMWICLGRIGT